MNIDTNLDLKNLTPFKKKMFFCSLLLIPVTIFMFIVGALDDKSSDNSSSKIAQSSEVNNSTKNKAAKKTAKEKEQKNKTTDISMLSMISQKIDISTNNPFVEMSALVKANKENNQENGTGNINKVPVPVPSTNNHRTNTVPRNVPLPSIPSRNNNNGIGNRNTTPASAPVPAPVPAPAPAQSTTVQGVLTGEDGNNMAIMSDGRVVSQGDVYGDGKIAFIGGDGIQFDNGETMSYK